jgi:hypothetical protein
MTNAELARSYLRREDAAGYIKEAAHVLGQCRVLLEGRKRKRNRQEGGTMIEGVKVVPLVAHVDDRAESPTFQEMNTVVIGTRNPSLIVVPSGVFHGWMALEDDTLLVSTASDVYNRRKPDEIRAFPDSFGYVWEVKGR